MRRRSAVHFSFVLASYLGIRANATFIYSDSSSARSSIDYADCLPNGTTAEGPEPYQYGRATWFIQEQQINGYQNASCLFCTLATYVNDGKHVPFLRERYWECIISNVGGVKTVF